MASKRHDDPLVTSAEVAAALGVKLRTVQRWTQRGELPSLTIGRVRRYDMTAVLERCTRNK